MTPRRKGRRGELEFANKYGGKRINDEGLPGPDIAIPYTGHGHAQNPTTRHRLLDRMTLWEVKRRKTIATLQWHKQAINEGADYLTIRQDQDTTWFIVHPVNQPCPCPLEETKPPTN